MIALLFLRLFMIVFVIWVCIDVLYPIITGEKAFSWITSVFRKKQKIDADDANPVSKPAKRSKKSGAK